MGIAVATFLIAITGAVLPTAPSLGVSAAQTTGDITFTELSVNAEVNPLGIDDPAPRLRWAVDSERRNVSQTRYQVLLASSPDLLSEGVADVWDSGQVVSAEPFVIYDGPDLDSRTRYHWTVRVWAANRPGSAWAPPAWFETAYLDDEEWQGEWISGPPRINRLLTQEERTADDACCLPTVEQPEPPDYCRPTYNTANNQKGQCAEIRPAPMLAGSFQVASVAERGPVVSARVYASGLAYNHMTLNGDRTRDGVLDPGQTRYDKTVQYTTDDVTALIRQQAGEPTENVLAAELGSGQFDNETISGDWGWENALFRQTPTLIADLHITYADGTQQVVTTDGTWKMSGDGPTRYDNFYLGETFDSRKVIAGWNEPGFDRSEWAAARLVEAPTGELRAIRQPSTRVVAEWAPASHTEPQPGMIMVDTGQETAGWATIAVHGASRGTTIQVRYADKTGTNGLVNASGYQPQGQIQTDIYIADGTGTPAEPEIWAPRFTYKGFQYVQLSSPNNQPLPAGVSVEVVSVQQVRTDMPPTGSFDSSSPLLNRIEHNVRSAMMENYVQAVITDTPTYEKNGWTGDAQLAAPAASVLFDTETQYWKSFQDMVDDQRPNGDVPLVSPGSTRYGYEEGPAFKPTNAKATPIWDAYWFVVPWESYRRYGDERALAKTYPAMKRYLDDWIPQWLAVYGDGDHTINSGLGDWTAPVGRTQDVNVDYPDTPAGVGTRFNTPRVIQLSSTAYLAYMAKIAADSARVLGDEVDAAHFDELFESIKSDFNARWWDDDLGYYREFAPCDRCPAQPTLVQSAQVLPLAFGLVPDEEREALAEKLIGDIMETRWGHALVGIAGMRWILPVLSEAAYDGVDGAAEAAYTIAMQTSYPSFGYWVEQLGWTSLGEYWESNSRTRNHHMHGSIGLWFYENLVGIQPLEPGYAKVAIRPTISDGLDSAEASYESVRGTISASWRQDERWIELEVSIPANTEAVVHVPAPGSEPGFEVREIGSGDYTFRVRR